MNPDEYDPREESSGDNSPLFFRHRRKMKIGGGIAFALQALWLNAMTSVSAWPHAPASPAAPTFLDGYAIMMILTIVAIALAFAAFRGRLRFLPGLVAFVAIIAAALAVRYYR